MKWQIALTDEERNSNFLFSPPAALRQCVGISCHDYAGSHQCQRVEAESFDLASKSSHSLQSAAYEKWHQHAALIINKTKTVRLDWLAF